MNPKLIVTNTEQIFDCDLTALIPDFEYASWLTSGHPVTYKQRCASLLS